MRRVLIVSPHFPPVNAADHQRVRMSLPYLSEFGWEGTVLAVEPIAIEGMPIDTLLERTVPSDMSVVRTKAVSHRLTRWVGLGNLALRALPFLWRAGNKLLAKSHKVSQTSFDLIFFSTTQFPVLILGPIWRRRFGVPYVVDFQDPWLDDYYQQARTPPPGGALRHRLSSFLARRLEPRVMQRVTELVCVSPLYVNTLQKRYSFVQKDQFTVLPFASSERDFELLKDCPFNQSVFDRCDERRHWVYAGVVGQIMARTLGILFAAIAKLREERPANWENVRFHFVGTSYAPSGRAEKTVEPIAIEYGVGDLVEERTGRLSYFETLQVLKEADALLIVGSDSPSYTPSKIYPYVLARRPLLALLHEDSAAVGIFHRCRAGRLVTFSTAAALSGEIEATAKALEETNCDIESDTVPDVDWNEFMPYTAREMTGKLCAVFDRAIADQNLPTAGTQGR